MSFFADASKRGWMYTGAILFNKLVPVWMFRCRRFVIYRLRISEPGNGKAAQDDVLDIDVSWSETDEQFESIESLTRFNRADAVRPVRAVQAMVHREIQGAIWLSTELFDEVELGVRVTLAPTQAWLFAAMVNKQMRGQGIYSAILNFITSELDSLGFEDVLVAVNPANKPSNHVHKKFAKSYVGHVMAVRCFNWVWCSSSDGITRKSSFTINKRLHPIEISVLPAEID